ncbi:hypothetical protein IJI31_03545 [bacterium]|nr:hypothetical protein [bacterium]
MIESLKFHKFNGFNRIKNFFRRNKNQHLESDIKARWAKNQIEPLQDTFTSTKDMYNYAKKRCTADLSGIRPKEHVLVIDLKNKKVLAEYRGTRHDCKLENISSLPINSNDIAVFHGHLDSMPISKPDVAFLLNNDVNQVIAINSKGEYSIIKKTGNNKPEHAIKSAYEIFTNENNILTQKYYEDNMINKYRYRLLRHEVLKENADSMGLKYITTYSVFK